MKKISFIFALLTPFALFAAEGAETNYDIVQRSVNFIIFAGILWYLLAEKIKMFFVTRSSEIQADLDKVQETLKESKARVDEAVLKLEDAKKLAIEIIDSANSEIETIRSKVAVSVENDIAQLNKNFDDKIKLESKIAKKSVVKEVLEELLSDDNIGVSQKELANIVLKKVV